MSSIISNIGSIRKPFLCIRSPRRMKYAAFPQHRQELHALSSGWNTYKNDNLQLLWEVIALSSYSEWGAVAPTALWTLTELRIKPDEWQHPSAVYSPHFSNSSLAYWELPESDLLEEKLFESCNRNFYLWANSIAQLNWLSTCWIPV